MLLTITLTRPPATDLGFLLHKSPGRVHTRQLAFGPAHVFYPEATEERCTAALLLDVDPIGLVRGRRSSATLESYVNDRPYVASSFLSVAIGEAFGTALAGRSRHRPELVQAPLPLRATLAVLPSRGGEALLHRLFEPLGYTVEATGHLLDETYPEWGDSPYFTVALSGNVAVRDLLAHLYVLIPVLDDQKHYWVSDPEIQKLLRRGSGWLAEHPTRELITSRYLARQSALTREALRQLVAEDDPDPDQAEVDHDAEEAAVEERVSLAEHRVGAVLAVLRSEGVRRVLDLGCGEGHLLAALLRDRSFTELVGVDVSARSLENAARRLRLERLPARQRERIRLLQGSLTYRDDRLSGYDAAVLMEVIEHVEPGRLPALERSVFEFARPQVVVVTTPNAEYNVRFEELPAGRFRHRDHRFEWTRAEFAGWANRVGEGFSYSVRFVPVGPEDAGLGPPTQMAVLTR